MSRKLKERARLLKLYEATGDDDYRRAAECLEIPLMEYLETLPLPRGRPAQRERDIPWQRLARIHRAVVAGASVLAAARREVEEHGYGHSENATITHLRRQYALRYRDLEWYLDWMKNRLTNSVI